MAAALVANACASKTGDGSALPTAGVGAGFSGATAGTTAGQVAAQAGVGGVAGMTGGAGAAGDGAAGTSGAAGMTAGTGGAGGSGAAGTSAIIEYVPSVDTLSKVGPFITGTITDEPTNAAYSGAQIVYPTNAEPPFALVAVIPGYTETALTSTGWWGRRLASFGFAVISLDAKNGYDCPVLRSEQLMAGLEVLVGENTREGSPLKGKLDVTKTALMGHSMGGGAVLIDAAAHPDLKAVIPMTPWSGGAAPCNGAIGPISFPTVTVPTMVIGGKNDAIAPENTFAHPFYVSIPTATKKAYMEFNEGGHDVANVRNVNEALLTRYVVSWLRIFMDGDDSYRAFITGAEHDSVKAMFSRYESNL